MAIFFNAGQEAVRPGVYQRYTQKESDNFVGAIDGVCAIAVQANWGPLGTVTSHETAKSITDTYGDGGTVSAALAMLKGGARTVHICRVGSGGAKATISLSSGSSGTASVTAKYEGTLPLSVSLQPKVGDSTKKVFTVYRDTEQVEKFEFATSENDDIAALIAAVNAKGSKYVTVSSSGTGVLTTVTNQALTGGTNPTTTNASYSTAWELLEPYPYNTIAVDTDETSTMEKSTLLIEYLNVAYQSGKLCMAVVGVPTSVSFDNRILKARTLNSERVVFLGGGFVNADGENVDGALAICQTAGTIAATPANQSIIHTVVNGAADTIEKLTHSQYEEAISNGMLMLSCSADGQVWYDSGVNTLVAPTENQDKGWKKIRRVKTRFEMMDRIDRALAPKIGKINCDNDGLSYIIQVAQGVLLDMVGEKKLQTGPTVNIDPDYPATEDSAWFVIDAVDIDSLERIYLHYQFRLSQEA